MRRLIQQHIRRALAVAAVAAAAGTTACAEGPTTAPLAPQSAAAKSSAPKISKGTPTMAGGKRRGGYNVVAD